ncbi:hypothetical protein LTR53_005271 [Teratosphaeriaceae sp. CCFEE 6253]|nr:hypothetical protein LTR53_005271 [Teratosphaeriaceae sp. CCFEE 6253]
MAWRSSGPTNEALVENLARHGLITQQRVKTAMLAVDRAHYAPHTPYQDSPQTIGHRATISAPHMHAAACESLLPYLHPGARVLDVGSGSGYLTHVLAELVKPGGQVVGVEHIQPLVDMGIGNTRKSAEGRELMDSGGIRYVKADGRLGWLEDAPYDAIHVGAAAVAFHQALIDQLKAPGRLFIPVEQGHMQHVYVIDKKGDGTVTRTKDMGVRYVPLTDAPIE